VASILALLMCRPNVARVLSLVAAFTLSACGGQSLRFVAQEEPWRDDDERLCLASGIVRESAFVSPRSALGGPSPCGALKPFTVAAAVRGGVELNPPALLRCPMIPALDRWIEAVVIPAANMHLGPPP